MRKVIMFDTSIATYNMGDYIINEAINREMGALLIKDYVVRYPTHTPVRKLYQKIKPNRFCQNADLKFLCGTNIFGTSLLRPVPNFNINIFDTDIYRGSISLGCGIGKDHPDSQFNRYTKYIYKKILSKKYIHSVRDDKTKTFLNSLGFEAVNTGCPTLWMLDEKHCSRIRREKGKNVVFTFTDYCNDEAADRTLLHLLDLNYEHLYYWIQGSEDFTYINKIAKGYNVNLIYPALQNYQNILLMPETDYVGTRLHAGIYAMQHFCRSIILVVDNRAKDMGESHNLPMVDRYNYNQLDNMINSSFETQIVIDKNLIKEWKEQFE